MAGGRSGPKSSFPPFPFPSPRSTHSRGNVRLLVGKHVRDECGGAVSRPLLGGGAGSFFCLGADAGGDGEEDEWEEEQGLHAGRRRQSHLHRGSAGGGREGGG